MDIDELLRAGSDICEDVVHAVNMNDYSDLGRKITERVNQATGQFTGQKPASQTQGNRQPGRNNGSYGPVPGARQPETYQKTQSHSNWNRDLSRTQPSFFLRNRVSRLRGLGKELTGIIGTAFNALLTMGAAMAAAAGTLSPVGAVIFGALTAGSVVLAIKGSKERKLTDKYYRYGREVGPAEYFSVRELADRVGLSEEQLRQEIEEMIKTGLLPQAKFDRARNTVILSNEAYHQYMMAEESRQQREAAEQASQDEMKRREERLEATAAGRDAAEVLRQGNAYLQRVRELNEAIPDEEMSGKLFRLEEIMNRIFEQVEKQPESAQSLRRFMDYYLPTTEKLLKAYVDLDKQPEVGDNIRKPKKQIEDAMDTINDAFETLLDSLFEDVAWDISSDINVMKTMMAQDGLTEEAGGFAQAAAMAEQE